MNIERSERIFSLFLYLTYNRNKRVSDLARMFGTGGKTIYRHIELFKNLGFEFCVTFGSVYRIVAFPKNFKRLFEIDMAENDGTFPCGEPEDTAIENQGLQAYEVLSEFKENCPFTKVPYLRRFTINANKLIKACKERKVVILHEYESDTRNGYCERKVEPFDFCWYFNYMWAYDTKMMQNRLFRVTQIGEVEITDETWAEQKRHKRQSIDLFGVSGHRTTPIKLRMSLRAKNRLISEHPMAIRVVKRIEGSDEWLLSAEVCSYWEVARFCMGFLDEVEILEGDGLEEFVIEYTERQLQKAKEIRAGRLAQTA